MRFFVWKFPIYGYIKNAEDLRGYEKCVETGFCNGEQIKTIYTILIELGSYCHAGKNKL